MVFNQQQQKNRKLRRKKEKKTRLTPKRYKTLLDWTNPQNSYNQQKSYNQDLDVGWGNLPQCYDNKKFRLISGNINGLSLDNTTRLKPQ